MHIKNEWTDTIDAMRDALEIRAGLIRELIADNVQQRTKIRLLRAEIALNKKMLCELMQSVRESLRRPDAGA